MAKNGFKVFDSDTHVGPVMEVLDRYITDKEKSKLPAWESFKYVGTKNTFTKGCTTYIRGMRNYRRQLGTIGDDTKFAGYNAAFTGREHPRTPSSRVEFEPSVRISEMDLEGVDVNLMLPSGWFGTWTASDDVELEMGMYAAYHRWMDDYCSGHPGRLGATLLVSPRDVEGSLKEIQRWGKSKWAWGILPYAPYGMGLDHPDLEPIWAAAEEHDLVVALHTFTSMPPYTPGGQDNWENMFLQRSAAHPWCGMRNMAALIGNGVMDRYPKLRIGTLEAGHSWLPFWLSRIDEHAETCSGSIRALKHKPSEYALSGRYFQSIEVHEGEKLTNSVSDLLGDDVLMFGSDYPHPESRFPHSVDAVLGWKMDESRKKKLMWDNAVKFYARCGLA